MKIAYVTTFDSGHPDAWSGAGYQIPLALEEAGADVVRVDNLQRRASLPALARLAISRAVHRAHHLEREPSVLRHYAQQIQQRLERLDVDVVLSPGSIPLTFVQTSRPKVIWTDSTFAGIVDYYPSYRGLTRRNLRDGNAMERLSLASCDLAAYNSDWAADSAVSLYGCKRSNVAVVPFGSNFAVTLSPDAIASLVQRRVNDKPVKLLFVGTQWERKGGDFALAVTDSLVRRGVDALITIVGSVPPREAPYVKTYGFVSKATVEGAALLDRCYREAHFLVHPAVAECNANVFSEACSFGLPIIANRTGGIATSVMPGKNGTLFELGDSPDSWADWIVNTLRDRAAYAALSMGAHRQFNEKLHWPVAAGEMLRLMEALVAKSRTRASSVAGSAGYAGPFISAPG
jgi:glycosyltransferase involved in cell wall biosynthesis